MLASDRQKRRVILGGSGWLPRPLRVAVRERLLERLELGRARRSPLFLVGHPKSGNTWLRTMVSRAYQARYGLPDTLVLKSDELALADPKLPRFCVTNGHYSYERVVGRILDATGGNYAVLFLSAALAYPLAVLAMALILRRSRAATASTPEP